MFKQYAPLLALVISLAASGTSHAASIAVDSDAYQSGNSPLFSAFQTPYSTPQAKQDYATEQDDNAISAVPVPAAAWLFVSGLVGLLTVSRRKKQPGKA